MECKAVIPRATIDEIEGHRRDAIAKFEIAVAAMQDAMGAASRAAGGTTFYLDDKIAHRAFSRDPGQRADFLEHVRQKTDATIWRHLIDGYGFEPLLDREENDKFRAQLEKDPPEVTAEAAYATLERLLIDADKMFRRGIANAFSKLDRRFRSHDGFKIGDRIVLTYAFTDYGSWNHHYNRQDTIRDIERVFLKLDGKELPERYAGFIGIIDHERRNLGSFERSAFQVEDEYFRFKAFKNGNAHLWFKRDDLLVQVNKLLAEHYGEVLGAGSDAVEDDPLSRRSMTPAKNLGWFPTPEGVVERIIGHAEINYALPRDGKARPHFHFLEPSAGEGAIALKVTEFLRDHHGIDHDLTMVEIASHRAETLQKLAIGHVMQRDFLELSELDFDYKFDRILMNPPFDRLLDVDHVVHALKFLAPGGRLVAVMSAGVEYNSSKKAEAFRKLVEAKNGRFYDLPPGSFESSGTMVNTCLLVLTNRE
jgi:16S rRNA G966 N2-methylase RsmD